MASQSVLILKQQDKFILFEYDNDLIDLPREQILDEADSGSSILAMARHIVSKISSGLKISYLTADNQTEVSVSTPPTASGKPEFVHSENLLEIWQSANYNIWADELCNLDYFIEKQQQEKDQCDKNTLNSPSIFYFIQEIQNFNVFNSLMKALSVKIHLLSSAEIINTAKISSSTKDLFSSQLRMNALLSPMVYKLNVILILNSLHSGESMVQQVLNGIPRMPTSALYHGVFRQNGQKWITYNSTNLSKDLPSDEELQKTNVIVMPGSSASSYQDQPWIQRYKKWIHNAYTNQLHLRFLGICFGEQIFAESLGGRCDKVKERKQDPNYYNYKVDPIHFAEEFYNLPYVKCLKLKNQTYYLSKAHGDIVEELNEKEFKVFGSSNKYRIEIFGDTPSEQNHNVPRVLCIQGHPEYVGKWILNKNSHFYSKFYKKPLQECIAQAYQEYISNPPDTFDVFRAICKSFITYGRN